MAVSPSPIPLANDTPLTLLTPYSKAPKRAAANRPGSRAEAPDRKLPLQIVRHEYGTSETGRFTLGHISSE